MQKLLIANRGEIALRIMKTARRMGIRTVAIYSAADRESPHVLYADEAYYVGEAPSRSSYLDMDKIIAICKQTQVDAIHPGYGFLSENAAFAKKVTDNGIVFVGPTPEAIEVMGSKLAAKETVKAYNVPMVPGTEGAISNVAEALEIANSIGFPLLIKASAGGGGKGMRIVHSASEIADQMQRAISEATSAFGDGSVFIERYVTSPRHIEIQIMADQHGNVVHLFERECSIQRRHQKVVEEAPSATLTPELREAMGTAAVDVAKSCNYVGAGTVEFLLDDQKRFYFLEMNTRLQVEHPVTEMITGVDLVECQLRVAMGEPLPFKQEDLKIKGHAVELRVYAEDPMDGFVPSIGKLQVYQAPVGDSIRVDDGFREGMDIPIHYDPMISKLITYGPTRAAAIQRMKEAIEAYKIEGIATTLPFGTYVMRHPAFISGDFDTHFVKAFFEPDLARTSLNKEEIAVAKASLALYLKAQKALHVPNA